jgi:ATP-dependent Clp protease ATP-binding subunit ClpA
MKELLLQTRILNRIDVKCSLNHLTRIDIWEICDLMIKSVQNRLKGINLLVDLSVQAFLVDEGYDPIMVLVRYVVLL